MTRSGTLMFRAISIFSILGILLIVQAGALNAASVEERLEQINRMPEKSRVEALDKEARKEGELVWYAAMASDRAAELIKAFESK